MDMRPDPQLVSKVINALVENWPALASSVVYAKAVAAFGGWRARRMLRCAATAVVPLLTLISIAQGQIAVGEGTPPPTQAFKPQKLYAGPSYSSKVVRLKIEARQPQFRSGDPVEVRLTLHNTSGHLVRYISGMPLGEVVLIVIDSSGREVSKTKAQPLIFGGVVPDTIAPHGSITLYDRAKDTEWFDLLNWRYDLREPGNYTIRGRPTISGPRLKRDATMRSNDVSITITN